MSLRADGFRGYQGPAPELVLCNPPFHHQQHVVDDYSGRRLLKQTAHVLAPGGELWLVANRHLPYGKTLRSTLGHIEQRLDCFPEATLLPLPRWLLHRYGVIQPVYAQQWEMMGWRELNSGYCELLRQALATGAVFNVLSRL